MNDWLIKDLKELEDKGLRRHLRSLSSPQSRECLIDGKKVLNFCSNNYLGLADDPRLVKAATDAMARYGFGAGASRLVCGNSDPFNELEARLAHLKGTESALVFNSGYAANTGIIPALMGRDDIIFADKFNHASIVDGIILSRAELKRYPHLDMEALKNGLKSASGFKKKLIVTDAVFSMDGDVAPLKEIVALARQYEALVMTDEAHGFGVLGKHGAGLAEELGVSKDIDIQMGTLSKAAGCFGAYVCGRNALKSYLINHARSFIYTTAMPPMMAAAALKAVDIIDQGADVRQRLKENADYLRRGLRKLGFDTLSSTTPIIPVLMKDSKRAVDASMYLLSKGIFVQAIRPPTVPINMARLRVTAMATHTKDDMDLFLSTMKEI